ncbi:MBL fold metallo-hydrolase [Maritimibacter sp. DP07]|uniref:MBL fold metallo-hydrolase n=1 Tax=Maritimibacter harenae TaxID=2606218 RepID=A0A845M317_9RHOB|nr:MBL fold metallo-hydrolase [Maritimibacter harenae]MZR13409.1 MBL fold metallo-hydrolase [Maritimibacter harenae]
MAAPLKKDQNAGWYRFSIGAFEGTVIWDGWIHHSYEGIYPNADAQEMDRLKAQYLLPADYIPMDLNPVLMNTGDKVYVIDAGMGRSIDWFGDMMGRMVENLRASGYAPEDVDAVLMTHLHPDHACGLINPDGTAVFPNADLYVCETDWEEWTNEDNLKETNTHLGPWTQVALDAVAPYRDRLKLFKMGDEIAPGITTFSVAGHALGQTAFLFESDGEKMVFTGDLAHHEVYDPHHPEWYFHMDYDSDPDMGAKAKADIFDKVVAEDITFHGYHFAFPGVGTIVDAKDGTYRFVPQPVTPRDP